MTPSEPPRRPPPEGAPLDSFRRSPWVAQGAPLLVRLPERLDWPPVGVGAQAEAGTRGRIEQVRALKGLTAFALVPREGAVRIGRTAEDSEVAIDSARVSRRHASLRQRDGTWFIEDLGSSNGTALERRRLPVETPSPLRSGQLLEVAAVPLLFLAGDHALALLGREAPKGTTRFPPEGLKLRDLVALAATTDVRTLVQGPVLLQVPTEPTEAAAADPEVDATVPIAAAALQRLQRSHDVSLTRVFPLAATSTVGRSAACIVRLVDASVSSEHAHVHRGADGVWRVADLGSRNGTFVGGKRLEPGLTSSLFPGVQVWFGAYRTVFLRPEELKELATRL